MTTALTTSTHRRPTRHALGALRHRNESRCAAILETSSALPIDDLPWGETSPTVDAEVINTLVYMRDVEGFTDRYLVGLAAHRTTLGDRLIGPFLDKWRREEAGHTAALERFLRWYEPHHDANVPERQMPPPAEAAWHERVLAHVGGTFGATVAAAHMTWGAANELLTLNGYRLLADRCAHPLLASMLRRIAAQESRHYSFYLLQAEWRLASSRVARIALRQVLQHAWTPVGIGEGYKSADEFARVLRYLATGPEGSGLLRRMDNRFAALPGLGDLRIFTAAAEALA
ncbi:MAG TPA: hypothetical protein VMZ22_09015 [Acidimicrobiales bacterium]|nr:hypothetical protein [Acidimicrobiales bacterium]